MKRVHLVRGAHRQTLCGRWASKRTTEKPHAMTCRRCCLLWRIELARQLALTGRSRFAGKMIEMLSGTKAGEKLRVSMVTP